MISSEFSMLVLHDFPLQNAQGIAYINAFAGYPQGLILKELAEYTLTAGVQKLLKSWYFGALPAKVGLSLAYA